MNSGSGSVPMATTGRRYDNDWLNVLAMFTVFCFHCARYFNHEGWHVKNGQLSDGMSVFVAVVAQWVMPLFFILSGTSSCYSLGGRGVGRYVGNRFKRLVIPLVFNIFVVFIPLQVWIERVSHGAFHGSFIAFYPHYFEGWYAFGGNFAWMGLHLWYLEMLFVFTLLTLPVFLLFKRATGAVAGVAGVLSRSPLIFLLALPLFGVELLVNLQPDGIGMRVFGGWSPLSYLTFYVLGFIIAMDGRFREALERYRFQALGLAVVAIGLLVYVHAYLAPHGRSPAYGIGVLLRSCNSWLWVAAFLGLGSRYLNYRNAFLVYAREAVLPFYVLHQTVIVTIGFLLISWNVGVMPKYLSLAATAFAVIMIAYEFIIRRNGVLRFLFGMGPKK